MASRCYYRTINWAIQLIAKTLLPLRRRTCAWGEAPLGHNPSNEAVQPAISAELALNRQRLLQRMAHENLS